MNLCLSKIKRRCSRFETAFCKTLVFSCIMLALFSCGKEEQKQQQVKNTNMEIANLNTGAFENRFGIFDRANSRFDYLGDKAVLIDFYAPWCAPCRMFAPILAKTAEEYKDRVEVYKIDIDAEPDLAARLSIRSIPTLLFIKPSGECIFTQGAMNETELKTAIDRFLLQ